MLQISMTSFMDEVLDLEYCTKFVYSKYSTIFSHISASHGLSSTSRWIRHFYFDKPYLSFVILNLLEIIVVPGILNSLCTEFPV